MVKRLFDVFFSLVLIIVLSPVLLLGFILASIDTKVNGVFVQDRIGQYGKKFKIFKLRSINGQNRISKFGQFLRKSKIDELPQLFNILFGDMSVVGPRPDIPGYYDLLEGENRKILELKPGLTSEASIKYKDEETLLEVQNNPLEYNDKVIFPDKVKMNLEYYYKKSFWLDLKIIFKTIF